MGLFTKDALVALQGGLENTIATDRGSWNTGANGYGREAHD
jgi:hypothetical protein